MGGNVMNYVYDYGSDFLEFNEVLNNTSEFKFPFLNGSGNFRIYVKEITIQVNRDIHLGYGNVINPIVKYRKSLWDYDENNNFTELWTVWREDRLDDFLRNIVDYQRVK